MALNVEKIDAQNNVLVVQGDVWRQRGQLSGSKVLSDGRVISGAALDGSDVRTIEDVGAPDICNGDGTVAEMVVSDGVFEVGGRRAAEETGVAS